MPRESGLSTAYDRTRNNRSRSRTRQNVESAEDSSLAALRRIYGRKYLIARQEHLDTAINTFLVGGLTETCQYCGALHFTAEKISNSHFKNCCHNGKVILPVRKRMSDPLPEMIRILSSDESFSQNYRENIRKYNAALAFASMNAKVVEFNGRGPYVYKINGQIIHQVSNLHPENEYDRRYGQLYMIEASDAIDRRLSFPENTGCTHEIMTGLLNILYEHNQYAQAYKTMYSVEAEMRQRGEEIGNLRIFFKKDSKDDQRRYNLPTANEVAALFVAVDGGPPEHIDFTIYPNSGTRQFMQLTSAHIDPMCYPLLFICGEQGWDEMMRHNIERATETRTSLTLLQFYSYRFAITRGFSILHNSGKLFQQFVVDAYFKIEAKNLNYIRFNQKKLRAECYQGLVDHVQQTEQQYPLGRLVILPSSFIGSPRNMHQNYQDAMAIVRKCGKPDLFITFTCNPAWPEIQNNIAPFDNANNRSDLVARVFNLKLKELIHDIKKDNVFGVPAAFLYVIEFQKRGLPHAHLLITLRDEDKILTPEQIDKIVSAEIPDPQMYPRLYEIVTKNMLHGPCGDICPNSPCMENGICKKKFPKEFAPDTLLNVNGYPLYKRPYNGRTVSRINNGQEVVFDNRHVVPYNAYFLYKYNAHINVEICASLKTVKYIHKYIYKGHDCASVEITDDRDEIKRYQHFRYISPPEAMWRILEYKLHDQSHTVIRLQIHLPGEQIVTFREDGVQDAIENVKDSMLEAWFKLNEQDVEARQYLYSEIPHEYTWKATAKKWQKRRYNCKIACRIYSVSISEHEKYFLRLLLLHVRGATSFDYLKTVDGICYNTFKESCEKRGLLDNENEIQELFEEAISFNMPKQLRFLFATLCVFRPTMKAAEIFEQFKEYLIEDFQRNHDDQLATTFALSDIKETLAIHGIKIRDTGLPDPGNISLETSINVNDELITADEYYLSLNTKQKEIVDAVLNASENFWDDNLFYIDGVGGTGKTHVYKTIIHKIRSLGKSVIAVAWTGIAATLLPSGRTVHSRFKLPVPLLESSSSSMRPNSKEAEELRDAAVIIWDEAAMAPKYALDILDKLLRDVTKFHVPFGGKVIVLGGDFRQVLPVIPRASPAAVIESSIKHSIHWGTFKLFTLTENMRAQRDPQFCNWLLDLGNDNLPKITDKSDTTIELPHNVLSEDIVNDIYGENITIANIDTFANTTILCTLNEDCFSLNDKVLDKIDGVLSEYFSIDEVEVEEESERQFFPPEFLHSLTPTGMPQHILRLKVGSIIMLLRNLNAKRGLCNGTRLVVQRCTPNIIIASILTGDYRGDVVLIPRITLAPSDTNLPFTLRRRQFPIRLAFAMTIYKSQGQTFSKIGIYLKNPIFSHGQLYVAFSRAQSFEDVKVQIVAGDKQGILESGNGYTVNIVHQQIIN